MRVALEGDGVVQRIQRTARAARIDNYANVPGWNAATARDLALTSGVGAPILTECGLWGAITVLGAGPPLPASAEARLEMFAKLAAMTISNAQARTDLRMLADEQAALRRVAELVARAVGEEELFHGVAAEASKLIDDEATTLIRVDDEVTCTVVAVCGGPVGVGTQIELAPEDEGIIRQILRTRSAARLDDYRARPGPAHARDEYGVGSSVGVPIIVGDSVWGILAATTEGRPLPASAEARLEQFSELIAAALVSVQARAEVQQLADEQSALRRVAELVARGVASEELFAAVAAEASSLLNGEAMTLTRFESESELVVVAACGGPAPVGTQIMFEAETLPDWVRRGDRVVRVDDYSRERDAQLAAQFGLTAAVAAPISVEGDVWGILTATSGAQPLPAGVEHRLQQFAKLVAAALANSQARADVQALADEQAALRHVAELAAREAPAEAILEEVAVQASALAGVDFTTLLRFEPDGSTEIVAVDGAPGSITVGMRASGEGDGSVQRVWRTGRAARIDNIQPRFIKSYMQPKTASDLAIVERAVARARTPQGTALVASMWRSFATPEHDLREQADKLTAPTQIVWGKNDKAIPLSVGRATHKRLPHSKLEILDTGHVVFSSRRSYASSSRSWPPCPSRSDAVIKPRPATCRPRSPGRADQPQGERLIRTARQISTYENRNRAFRISGRSATTRRTK